MQIILALGLGLLAAIFVLRRSASEVPKYFTAASAKLLKDSSGVAAPESLAAAAEDTASQLNIIQHEIFAQYGPQAVINISSGYRSPAYNAQIGGVQNSYHTKAQALDFSASGVPPTELHKLIYKLIKTGKIKPGGIGQGRTYTHYDTRGESKTWTYSGGNSGASISQPLSTLE